MTQPTFKQPDNLSLAQPNTFKFALTTIPNVVYNLQRVDLPGINISGTTVPTGPWTHADFSVPGEKLTYDPLTMGVLMDEDFIGWKEVHDWMRRCTVAPGATPKTHPIKELADGTLLVNNNYFKSNIQFTFYNMYPTYLGTIPFDYSIGPDSPITYDITLNYSHYDIKLMNR